MTNCPYSSEILYLVAFASYHEEELRNQIWQDFHLDDYSYLYVKKEVLNASAYHRIPMVYRASLHLVRLSIVLRSINTACTIQHGLLVVILLWWASRLASLLLLSVRCVALLTDTTTNNLGQSSGFHARQRKGPHPAAYTRPDKLFRFHLVYTYTIDNHATSASTFASGC